MGRENFKLTEEVSQKFAELADAMGKSKTELIVYLIESEYERREDLLKAFHRMQELRKQKK